MIVGYRTTNTKFFFAGFDAHNTLLPHQSFIRALKEKISSTQSKKCPIQMQDGDRPNFLLAIHEPRPVFAARACVPTYVQTSEHKGIGLPSL